MILQSLSAVAGSKTNPPLSAQPTTRPALPLPISYRALERCPTSSGRSTTSVLIHDLFLCVRVPMISTAILFAGSEFLSDL